MQRMMQAEIRSTNFLNSVWHGQFLHERAIVS